MKLTNKTKVYLDTSIISFYYAEDSPEKSEVTRRFFEVLEDSVYEVYISNLNIVELEKTSDHKLRSKLMDLAYNLEAKRLSVTAEVGKIVDVFIQEEIIPERYRDDAVHITLALHNSMDFIVSWNFKHIVKPKTKRAVRAFAIQEGYKEVEIITPQEVTENGE